MCQSLGLKKIWMSHEDDKILDAGPKDLPPLSAVQWTENRSTVHGIMIVSTTEAIQWAG